MATITTCSPQAGAPLPPFDSMSLKNDTSLLRDRLTVIWERPTPARPKERTILLFFHGLGDTAAGWGDLVPHFAQACPAIDKIIVPTAPTVAVTVNGGAQCTAWFDIVISSFSPMELLAAVNKRPPYIDNSMVDVLYVLNKELEAACAASATRLNVIVGGFSQGAHMAFMVGAQLEAIAAKSLAGGGPVVACTGIVMLSGVIFGLDDLRRGIAAATPAAVPILQCHGTADPVIPLLGAQMTSAALRKMGWAGYEFKEFAGMAHSSCPEEIQLVVDFLKRASAPASAPAPAPPAGDRSEAYLRIPHNDKSYPPGQEVEVRGLKAKPELNGTRGTVESFDKVRGRYAVKLQATGETLALQGANLAGVYAPGVVCGAYLRVDGLKGETSRPWNGALGQVLEHDAEKGRYLVDLGCGSRLRLKRENLVP